ncbi:MAG: hypothetical protein ACLFQ6_10025 [Candidatus Sumerlaeia bacterium]
MMQMVRWRILWGLLFWAVVCAAGCSPIKNARGPDIFPLYRNVSSPDGSEKRLDILWPFYASEKNDQDKWVRGWPLFFYCNAEEGKVYDSARKYWMNGFSLLSVFRVPGEKENLVSLLYPYAVSRWSKKSDAGSSWGYWLIPITMPRRDLPVLEHDPRNEKAWRFAFMTIYKTHREDLSAWGFFPLYGQWSRQEPEGGWYFLCPLFGSWVSQPGAFDFFYPLIPVKSPEKDGDSFYKRTFIGPIFQSSHINTAGEALFSRFLIFPIYMHTHDPIAKRQQWTLWPLGSYEKGPDTNKLNLVGPMIQFEKDSDSNE